ncbi:MAG: PSP1 C-terminal domain-containing protein, partial [Nitrospinae bacterium]|nr:PSP1 C-terminal domain-containing protein [Nitrospinota bacterium]
MNETTNGGVAVETPPETRKLGVVGVKTRFGARPVHHTYGELRLRVGMKVMVKSKDGDTEFGEISENPRVMDPRYYPDPLPEVLRVATEDDEKKVARTETNEKNAYDFCRMKISELKLPMRLIEVRY